MNCLSYKRIVLLSLFFLIIPLVVWPQETTTNQPATEKSFDWGGGNVPSIKTSSSAREEIHRYMGYEKLLPKYISLPYDVSMNTNMRGEFVDIGFLLLSFIPVILLLGIKKPWVQLILILLLTCFLIICMSTGYSSFHRISIGESANHIVNQFSKNYFTAAPLIYIKLQITSIGLILYQGIDSLFKSISGEGDYITFPILLLSFIGLFSILRKRLEFSDKPVMLLINMMFLYGFLWWLLGAGIVWYGILLVIMGLICMSIYAFRQKKQELTKIWSYSFFFFSSIWLLLAITNRFADYKPDTKATSLGAISSATLSFATGRMNEQQIMNAVFVNYTPALNKINANKSVKVYRAGTFFHYFIANNNERVMEDNQLSFFDFVSNRVPDKVELAKEFKRNGYGFFIYDLHTASIDLTPNKSLTRKAQVFTDFVTNNPALRLIATDRVVQGNQVTNPGRFVVFEII